MAISVEIRAKRILKRLGSFQMLDQKEEAKNSSGLNLGSQEKPIAIYEHLHEKLVVTNLGLIIFEKDGIVKIPYVAICNVYSPLKMSHLPIKLALFSGEEVEINMSATREKFSDAYEFVRFLLRVIEDWGVRGTLNSIR